MKYIFPLFILACGDEIKIAEPSTEEGEFLVDEDGEGGFISYRFGSA